MITEEESIPERGEAYLLGQDVLWTQFNDINFYVEDIDQENLYLVLFKRLLPNVRIGRVFPLGGKDLVLREAERYKGQKDKVYILDLDFDGILKRKREDIENLFYFDAYSLENCIIDSSGIIELIKEERPRMKVDEIENNICYEEFKRDCCSLYELLGSHFLLSKKLGLNIPYHKVNINRDVDFRTDPPTLKDKSVADYYSSIQSALESDGTRVRYSVQLRKLRKYFRGVDGCCSNMPGKYLLLYLQVHLRRKVRFPQMNIDVMTYRLMKNSDLSACNRFKRSLQQYLSNP